MDFTEFENDLLQRAKARNLKIALPETAFSERIKSAAQYFQENGIAKVITINSPEFANQIGAENYDIVAGDRLNSYAQTFFEMRKNKGITYEQAYNMVMDPFYFSAFLQRDGIVDAVVGGAKTSTAKVLMPAFQVVGCKGKRASSCFILQGEQDFGDNGFLLLGDCAVNVLPDQDTLVEIAEHCCSTYSKIICQTPKVAFLSYSTSSSASGELVDKVKNACLTFKNLHNDISCDGEVQADAALYESTAKLKIDNSQNMGKSNVLIFPDLQSGNIGYKLMRYAGKLNAYGPIVQGTKKPFCDLSRSSDVKEIIITMAIALLLCD